MDLTQLGTTAAVLGFIAAAFWLYRSLSEQKDAQIALLKAEIESLKRKLADAESQTPNALTTALSSRITIAIAEISRLKEDGNAHREEIRVKEAQLLELQEQLSYLTRLMEIAELVCPNCGAPLIHRTLKTVHGSIGGHECEADFEVVEYACGYATDGDTITPCGTYPAKS